jgi:hypothetical protein
MNITLEANEHTVPAILWLTAIAEQLSWDNKSSGWAIDMAESLDNVCMRNCNLPKNATLADIAGPTF